MMNIFEIKNKVSTRIWLTLVRKFRNKRIYPYLYRSYWHYHFITNNTGHNETAYFAARPNSGAGIGHQLANWIAGYWFAKQFNLKFAHLPFSTPKWNFFLGFHEGETQVTDLLKSGYRKRRLPLFDEYNQSEVETIKAIIASYAGSKVVFLAEQDQGYQNQYGVCTDITRKFNLAQARQNDRIIYDSTHFNISVHVRRTVVIGNKVILENDAAKSMRWLNNDYYEKVLKRVLKSLKVSKPISIYIFSTGKQEEFAEFSKYGDVHFCSMMDEYESFLHLIRADLLITSKSSFSYKAALISDGIKVCPRNFWHGYPNSKDWILVENDGTFEMNKLDFIS